MPTYEVTSPDGKTWDVQAPDGATQEQVMAYAKQQWAAQVKQPPAAVQAGSALMGIPRQLGLTGRYALEGGAGVVDMLTSPFRVGLNAIGVKNRPYSEVASEFADKLGMPSPQGANERVVGDMSRLVAGAGGMAGGAQLLGRGATGLTQMALNQLAAGPGTQAIAAAGAGAAGGSVREAGGGPGAQFAASLAGGLAGGIGANVAQSAGSNIAARAKALVTPDNPQAIDQQISLVLRGSGIDWSQVPERVRQAVRAEAAQALNTGGTLSADATRRLIDFKSVPGATPTRGMLTQDPVQITREMNLAKTGANSTDLGLQRLPTIQNQNAQSLLDALDTAGARNAPDAYATGQRVIGALQGRIDASRGRIDSLYQSARDTQGRSAPLDGATFTTRASQLLDEGLLGGALPKSVEDHLNRIARGEVPFTVDYAEQLKTAMGKLQRGTNDGQARMALGVVRQALEETPLRGAPTVNPGNLPAAAGAVPPSSTMGADSIAAFNRARTANRAFMNRVENTPALEAVMNGAEPDKFVQQFVIGSGASLNDVRQMGRAVAANPDALSAVKANIAAHLKAAATNGAEDVTKFSSAAYNRALRNIGERKLGVFFDPEEVRQLQAIGRVGTLMQAQPAGTAVNNSNTGALVLGRMLDALPAKLPFGLNSTVEGVLRAQQQGSALNVPAALRALPQAQSRGLLQQLGPSPLLYGSGLLGAPTPDFADERKNQR
jgi:hypothetical protein